MSCRLVITISSAHSLFWKAIHGKLLLDATMLERCLEINWTLASLKPAILMQHCDRCLRMAHNQTHPSNSRLIQGLSVQLYTLHQLCAMHEIGGLRMNRYRELGQYAFGASPCYP